MSDVERTYRCEKGHEITRFDLAEREHLTTCEYRGEHQWDWFGALCGAPCVQVEPWKPEPEPDEEPEP